MATRFNGRHAHALTLLDPENSPEALELGSLSVPDSLPPDHHDRRGSAAPGPPHVPSRRARTIEGQLRTGGAAPDRFGAVPGRYCPRGWGWPGFGFDVLRQAYRIRPGVRVRGRSRSGTLHPGDVSAERGRAES